MSSAVDDSMIRVAEQYARGDLGLALVDFQRSGYMEAWDPAYSAVLHTSSELADAWDAASPTSRSRNVGKPCGICPRAHSAARS